MKRLLWPGIFFLSISWLFILPIFSIPDYNIGIGLMITGIVFNTFAFWKQDFKKIDRRYLLIFLIPLIISLFVIPLPYIIGPIILLIATICYLLKNKNTNWVFLGLGFSGLVLTIQTLLYPLYVILVSHEHRIDILTYIISPIANLFGLDTSVNNDMLFVPTHQETWAITTTWEKLGFFPWFNMLIAGLLIFFFLSKSKKISKYLLGFLLISFVYLILRYIMIITIFIHTKDMTILWEQTILIISFIPFMLLLVKFLPLNELKFRLEVFAEFKFDKKQILAMLFAFIFMFSLVGAFVFQDPGTGKQGRILIDEVHSEWENTTKPLDKEYYGMLSTYNYYNWAEWLDKYYFVDRNTDNYLTLDLLNNYDILVLKCPTNMYSDKEISDIVQFVQNGGGLYLIGDHTNVFGMNFYLNLVSENFGITFKTDSTYELGTGMTSTYEPDNIFPHPVVQNMEEFEFLTSCTVSAPLNSENIIVGNLLLGEPGTYSTENFFREDRKALDIEYGLLLQVVGVKHGEGRIVAFTDSTCFSNFCMFMDGYKNFNLGVMEYLNRENSLSYLNTVFTIVALVSLVISLFLLSKEKTSKILFIFLVAGILAFSLSAPVFSYMNNENYKLPSPRSDFPKVCFDQEHSDFTIQSSPNIGFTSSNKQYGTFFVWTQRVGWYPSIEKTLEDSIQNSDAVVIINPVETFEDEEINQLTEYVESGGQLLVMDSALNPDSTANELLQNFGIWLSYETQSYGLYNKTDNTTIGNATTPYLAITGGENLLVTEQNETRIAFTDIEQGRVVVVIDSYTFNDNVMGGTFTEPDDTLRKVYDLEYYIFEELLKKI